MNKKPPVAFKQPQKQEERQSRNIWTQQTEEKDIEVTIKIKDRKIQTLINSTSDISYMNPQLHRDLEIKNRKRKQILIVWDVKQNEITQITKQTEKVNMRITSHKEEIVFSKMKMSEHKIMLEMNWLQRHNSRIDWKTKRIIMRDCKCRIRQTQTESWAEIKKQVSEQYWEYEKLFTKSSKNQALPEHKSWDHEILLKKEAVSEKLSIYQLLSEKLQELQDYFNNNL